MKSIRATAWFAGALIVCYTESDLLGFLVREYPARAGMIRPGGVFFYPKMPTPTKNHPYQWLVWGGAMAGMGGGNGWYGPLPADAPELYNYLIT